MFSKEFDNFYKDQNLDLSDIAQYILENSETELKDYTQNKIKNYFLDMKKDLIDYDDHYEDLDYYFESDINRINYNIKDQFLADLNDEDFLECFLCLFMSGNIFWSETELKLDLNFTVLDLIKYSIAAFLENLELKIIINIFSVSIEITYELYYDDEYLAANSFFFNYIQLNNIKKEVTDDK